MNRIVFDANVWVSFFAFPGPVPRATIDIARQGHVVALGSEAIVQQVVRTLNSMKAARVDIPVCEQEMRAVLRLVEPRRSLAVITIKESDNRVLKCAKDGAADYIVSGDRKHLLALGSFEGIPIISPRDFVTRFSQGVL